MSAEGVISIVLGSTVVGTVLGTVLGARLEADKQREEAFRERMVTSAVDFLKQVTSFYKAIYAAHEVIQDSGGMMNGDREHDTETALAEARTKALGEARAAIMEATSFVPVQRVVFPGKEVSAAATDLVGRMDSLFAAVEALPQGSDQELTHGYATVDEAHAAYADLVNRAIREAAFRRRRTWLPRGPAHRELRARTAGERVGREPAREPGSDAADSPV